MEQIFLLLVNISRSNTTGNRSGHINTPQQWQTLMGAGAVGSCPKNVRFAQCNKCKTVCVL